MPFAYNALQPFTRYQEVSASRAFGTVYQNTTGKIMLVVLTVSHAPVTGSFAYVEYVSDANAAPATVVGQSGITAASPAGLTLALTGMIWVSPNHYYKVTDNHFGAGTNTILKWVEAT